MASFYDPFGRRGGAGALAFVNAAQGIRDLVAKYTPLSGPFYNPLFPGPYTGVPGAALLPVFQMPAGWMARAVPLYYGPYGW